MPRFFFPFFKGLAAFHYQFYIKTHDSHTEQPDGLAVCSLPQTDPGL